jgi:hypothetical protein
MRRLLITAIVALAGGSAAWAQQPGPIQPPPPPAIKRIPLHPEVPPPPLPPEQIIQRFTANEASYKEAFAKFGYVQTIDVEESGTGGAPNGSYTVKTEIYSKPNGERYERILNRSESTLQFLHLSSQDLEILASMPLFPLAGDAVAKYKFEYRGTEKLDELMTYVFRVEPKSIETGTPLFSGLIWVDNEDLAIVKSYGQFLTGLPKTDTTLPFSFFETYRENTEGKYWFPTYIRSEDVVTKHDVDIPIRLVIRSTDFHPGQPVLPAKPGSN